MVERNLNLLNLNVVNSFINGARLEKEEHVSLNYQRGKSVSEQGLGKHAIQIP